MENKDKNPIEICVVCGEETPYKFQDNINIRIGYIEGVGQTCKNCFIGPKSIHSKNIIPRSA
jgi:hypothetical protein